MFRAFVDRFREHPGGPFYHISEDGVGEQLARLKNAPPAQVFAFQACPRAANRVSKSTAVIAGLLNFYVNVQIDRRRPKHILCLAYTPPRSQRLRPKISPRDSRDIPLGIYDTRLGHAIGCSLGRDGVEDIA